MRILVLTINYWPEQTGIGAVITRRCEYLASLGHEVIVCTGMPYYPEWKVDQKYSGRLFVREEYNGVSILRTWIWVPKKVTSMKRVLFESSFLATSLVNAVRQSAPDLLISVSPPLGLGLSAIFLKRLLRLPYIFDVEDLQPDAAADLGMLPPRVLPWLYRIESAAYRHAELITTVTEGMRRKIISKGISSDRVFALPAAADNNFFAIKHSGAAQTFREKHGLRGKFCVVHSGNMGVKQGLDVVLDAALLTRDNPQMVYLLVGDGVMKQHLTRRVEALSLDNVKFLPVQAHSEFIDMLGAIDTALVVQQASVSDTAFPSKTVTLLSAARPVVASVSESSEVGQVIQQSKAGVVIESENAELLATTLQDLFKNPSRRLAMAECGRNYALTHWHQDRVFSALESYVLMARAAKAHCEEIHVPAA